MGDSAISKLLLCPFFGDLPPWVGHWRRNITRLEQHGYAVLIDQDEEAFRARVRRVLDIECAPMAGTGNIWDFRPALGMLYADELQAHGGFDFWGHTDLDCVYGRVENWVTDEFLDGLDIHSNHDDYICGPWSLYRNTPTVNQLFRLTGEWRDQMSSGNPSGWAEKGFTAIVDAAHNRGMIRRAYTKWQTKSQDDFDTCRLLPDGRLMEGDDERAMLHFRRTKEYPAGCVLA